MLAAVVVATRRAKQAKTAIYISVRFSDLDPREIMNYSIPYCALILRRTESGESGYSSSSLGCVS